MPNAKSIGSFQQPNLTSAQHNNRQEVVEEDIQEREMSNQNIYAKHKINS